MYILQGTYLAPKPQEIPAFSEGEQQVPFCLEVLCCSRVCMRWRAGVPVPRVRVSSPQDVWESHSSLIMGSLMSFTCCLNCVAVSLYRYNTWNTSEWTVGGTLSPQSLFILLEFHFFNPHMDTTMHSSHLPYSFPLSRRLNIEAAQC